MNVTSGDKKRDYLLDFYLRSVNVVAWNYAFST